MGRHRDGREPGGRSNGDSPIRSPTRHARRLKLSRRAAAERAAEHDRNTNPNGRKREIQQGEVARAEAEPIQPGVDDPGLDHVTEPPEKTVDGRLALELLRGRQRQVQRMPRGVHDRVVDAVLDDLQRSNEAENRQERDQAVADEREHRQYEQRPVHAEPAKHSAHDEHLQNRRQGVHGKVVVAIEGREDFAFVERRRRGLHAVDLLQHELRQQVLAGGIDAVQDHDERREQREVTIAQQQRESVPSR